MWIIPGYMHKEEIVLPPLPLLHFPLQIYMEGYIYVRWQVTWWKQIYSCGSGKDLVGASSVVKNLPANAEDAGLICGSESSLEKGMATQSSTLVVV